jgi:hypothetical protein
MSNKSVKYPSNLDVKRKLKRGDAKLLAGRSRYTYRTVYEILCGHRQMPDSLAVEIVKLINERKEIAAQLQEAIL